MTIKELALKTVDAVQAMGLSQRTAWDEYGSALVPIISAHETQGKDEFDRDVITAYAEAIKARLDAGEISRNYYRSRLRGLERLVELHDTGHLEWSGPKYSTRFKLNDYYLGLLDKYLEAGEFSVKGKSDAMWICRKFFAWLQEQNHADLGGTGAAEIQKFMIYCSKHMRSTSVHNAKLYMAKLCAFLYEEGLVISDYKDLLTFKVSRESPLLPAADPDEVAEMLNVIDRRMPRGKRDYAIIMLGTVAGMRAGDIARLRLRDINWQQGEIKIRVPAQPPKVGVCAGSNCNSRLKPRELRKVCFLHNPKRRGYAGSLLFKIRLAVRWRCH